MHAFGKEDGGRLLDYVTEGDDNHHRRLTETERFTWHEVIAGGKLGGGGLHNGRRSTQQSHYC